MAFRVFVLTASDAGSRGEREDKSGPCIEEMVTAAGYEVTGRALLPDDREALAEKMREVCVVGGVKGADYVRVKYEVNKAKLAADIKAGVLGKADLTKLNIALEPTVNFKVDRVKTEKELYDLKAAAIELAESVEQSSIFDNSNLKQPETRFCVSGSTECKP